MWIAVKYSVPFRKPWAGRCVGVFGSVSRSPYAGTTSQTFVPQVSVFSGTVGSFVAIQALIPPTMSDTFVRPA
jgi:hypothetical protein